MARSEKYWEQRALERLTLIERHSSEYMDQISKLYSDAKQLIYADIERILQKYIRDSGLGAKEARELLSTRESQDILGELRKRLSTITDDQIRRQILNRLNAPAYRARISRLQAIESSIDTTIKQIAPLETSMLEQSLIDTADLAYYRTMFDTQRGLGVNFSFSGLNEETVRSVMDEKWSGKHFSKRVWQNTDIVSAKLQEIVRQNVLTGRSWRRCMSEVEGFVDTKNAGAKFASERLLRTETNYVYNAINAKAYQSIGVEKYRYLATLDGRTSSMCQEHDGNIDPDTKKEYTYENMKIGKNYPPLHAFCRSVTTARLDPELEARLTRTARDPATGKAYQVPYSMTYPQWVKSLSPEQQNQMTLSRKMAANKASDLKQYEKYREAKIEGLPRGADQFQQLKYTNPPAYSEMKKAYAEYKAFADKITTPEEATRFIRQYANKQISWQKQKAHAPGKDYVAGKSVFTADAEQAVLKYSGTGQPQMANVKGVQTWRHTERIVTGETLGEYLDRSGNSVMTECAIIHYSKTGAHVVPSPPLKGG
ncbi:MAG: minor capsid protein [Oscillospiraceae bacterium]|nr:minor capsid protein [Oscillospiraceae bacterium]